MGELYQPTAADYAMATAQEALKVARGAQKPAGAQKRRVPTPAAKKARKAATAAIMDLSEGDSLEYSISASTRTRKGGEVWVKAGGSTTIREDETGVEAKDRLRTAVEHFLTEAVKEVTS